jgi:hypothetical protein
VSRSTRNEPENSATKAQEGTKGQGFYNLFTQRQVRSQAIHGTGNDLEEKIERDAKDLF